MQAALKDYMQKSGQSTRMEAAQPQEAATPTK